MRPSFLGLALLGLLGAGDASLAKLPTEAQSIPASYLKSAPVNDAFSHIITVGGEEELGLVKRDRVVSTVSSNPKNLIVGATYTISFSYTTLFALRDNSCRIETYWNDAQIGTTPYFRAGFSSKKVQFQGTVKPTASSGKINAKVVCTGYNTAIVYIDKISTTKTADPVKTTSSAPVPSSTSQPAVPSSTVISGSSTTVLASTTQVTAVESSASTTVLSSAVSTQVGSSTETPSSAVSTQVGSSTETPSVTVSTPADSSTETPSSTVSTPTGSSTSVPTGGVDSTILVIASNNASASDGSLGLLGYGIPYEHLIIPKEGIALPTLNSSSSHGNYGGIIIVDSVSYEYANGWASAITADQWTALYAYQADFRVRMVRINEYPGPNFGTTTTSGGGCCESGVEQMVSFTDISDFPTANLKANAEVSTSGLWHVPATITDTATTKQVAKFGKARGFDSDTVAAVINNFNGREQFVWFIGWAPDWSLTSSYLQHAHIHWMTRGLFIGMRKIHLGCQIDDVQISTELYYPPDAPEFKIQIADLEAHVEWQRNINSRMPAGSDFFLELGHNGNGDFITATAKDDGDICNPDDAVFYDSPPGTTLEYVKERGTGSDVWPNMFEEYSWSKPCAELDDFASWFMIADNRNQFAHVSHTFTHLGLNNATYHDAKGEIQFNQAWMAQTGIDKATRFSAHGLIPPAITGLHNGDVIQAWLDNGITHVVGDNTRPVLRNTGNSYWPLISTVADNGYDGLTIIPRFSTAIYFNCHTMECTLKEWIATSAGSGDYFNLLASSKASTIRNLLALMSDPYMFHQANMHQTTVESITIGDQTGKMSLVMSWTETMAQEMMRLTNWPIKTLKHDDFSQFFLDRKALDGCNAKMSYTPSADGSHIESVTVTANNNQCSVPIPVTIPSGSSTASGGKVTSDVVGSEAPIQWVTLQGSPVTLKLSAPVTI